ncbi:MAG: DNA polymerase III subunit gamma/tau [Candidatus Omnitrophica bacterium]|nr:DNA polymerase III subunit gamma/tau [Candidatus Omnitrophota bacterium]
MAYQPLARKYRPQTFEDLTGQAHVTTTLARAIEMKRIGQAYLFSGQRGVGKTSAARILAKCLNCAAGPAATPCQRCPSCVGIAQGSSLDVIEIDGASNRGIDEVRSLRETVKFAPTQGRYRIYILDEVRMLTTEAFNALLKTLEEPPEHVKFIFATTAPQKVPATILSRCQRFDFRRLEAKTAVGVLERICQAEKIAAEPSALYAIARASEGSLRDAEVVLDQLASYCAGTIKEEDVSQLLGAVEQDGLLAWTQAIIDRDVPAALRFLNENIERGRDVIQLLLGLLAHLRHLLIVRATTGASGREACLGELIDLPAEQLPRLEEQAAQVSTEELLVMVQLLTGAYDLARRSPFAQAVVEFALIRLAHRESWTSLDQILKRLEALDREAGSAGRAEPIPPPPSAKPVAASSPSAPRAATRSEASIHPAASAQPCAEATQAVAAAPEEAATDAGALLGHVTQRWDEIIEQIGKRKISLAAYLMEARPLAVDKRVVQVGLPAFALHQEVLGQPEHFRVVEEVLREMLGRPMSVVYTTMPQTSGAEPPSAEDSRGEGVMPPIVEEIVNLFNAKLIDRPRSSA